MNINDPTIPQSPREMLNELCTYIAGMAKLIHDLTVYGYSMENIEDMVVSSMKEMDIPEEHRDAAVKAYATFTHQCHGPAVDIALGARKAIEAMLGDQKSVACAVMFRSGASLQGELSESEWGGLRMLTTIPSGGKVMQFFDYEDVCVVAREVATGESEPTLIVRS
jgi:hypothetical protein